MLWWITGCDVGITVSNILITACNGWIAALDMGITASNTASDTWITAFNG